MYPIEVRRLIEVAPKHHATPCGNIVTSLVKEYLHGVITPRQVVKAQHLFDGFGLLGLLKGIAVVATHVIISTVKIV